MSEVNNFWKGVLIGAVAGGALSMLDKQTRNAVMTNYQKASKNVTYLVKNPSVIVDKVKTTSEQMRQTFEQVSEDIFFIKDRVEELSQVTPNFVDRVEEKRDAFSDNGDTYTEVASIDINKE